MTASRELIAGTIALGETRDERSFGELLRHWCRIWLHKPLGLVGLSIITALAVMALGAPLIDRYDPAETFYRANASYDPTSTDFFRTDRDATILYDKAAPSAAHWLGTDDGGRDTWARVVWGTRRSLGIAIASLVLGVGVGTALGIISGYFRGTVDTLMQRLLDALQSFPPLLLLILGATAFELSVRNIIITLAVIAVPQVSRIVRGNTLALREMPFVEAARVIGSSDLRLMTRHILPNTWASIIVVFTIGIGTVIVAEAALSFLALTPPGISWGRMLYSGVNFINVSPWLSLFAGLAITLAVLAFNLVGDALRDILDPRLRI